MDKRRDTLPPLDTLVFFDAVVRHGGFTAASSELYVSQAAVSKRVRQLENWLGVSLFDRGARSLTLTDAGVKLSEPVAMALDYVQTSLDGVKAPSKPRVRIVANNAVSVFWLFPKIKAFAFSAASCPVETVASDDPAVFQSTEHDLAIVYCESPPMGWDGVKLMDEELVPVLSPRCAKDYAQNPQEQVLLDYERYAPDWINWDVWAKRNPPSGLTVLPKRVCQTYSQSIGRAIAGEGIALASCALLHDELASGALVALDKGRLKTGMGYFLLHRTGRIVPRQVAEFAAFLENVSR